MQSVQELRAIGDRWTLLILRSAFWGVRRFDDFQADIDVPRSVLSNRLAALVESGIMERREYREAGQRARIEYPLTRMGQALGLPFMAMTAWGDKWLGDGISPSDAAVEIDRSKIFGRACRRTLQTREGIGYRDGHRFEI